MRLLVVEDQGAAGAAGLRAGTVDALGKLMTGLDLSAVRLVVAGVQLNAHWADAVAFPARDGQRGTLAGEWGAGLLATDADVVNTFCAAGDSGPRHAEVPLAWAPDVDTAVEAVLEKSPGAVFGWKVMTELPEPVSIQAGGPGAPNVRSARLTQKWP